MYFRKSCNLLQSNSVLQLTGERIKEVLLFCYETSTCDVMEQEKVQNGAARALLWDKYLHMSLEDNTWCPATVGCIQFEQ